MKNSKSLIGKFIIMKDLEFTDFMKDEKGQIKLYDTFQETGDICGMYEFEDVLICEIKHSHQENE